MPEPEPITSRDTVVSALAIAAKVRMKPIKQTALMIRHLCRFIGLYGPLKTLLTGRIRNRLDVDSLSGRVAHISRPFRYRGSRHAAASKLLFFVVLLPTSFRLGLQHQLTTQR
jgi:hypothetical protein